MALKRALGIALSKPAHLRDKVDLENLTDFFSKYKFFKNLAQENSLQTVHQVMRHVKFQRVLPGGYLIDEQDDGDKFYVIIKGDVGVEIAMETPVPEFDKVTKVKTKIFCYLQALYENYDKVFWQRVPYAM